jgi:hypothetical protein
LASFGNFSRIAGVGDESVSCSYRLLGFGERGKAIGKLLPGCDPSILHSAKEMTSPVPAAPTVRMIGQSVIWFL